MRMSPALRKLALTVHLTTSLGWVGAVIAYLGLGIAAVESSDTEMIRAAWTAMEVTGWWVIVPLAIAALVTGLVMSRGTRWGLFRHYWTLISLALTVHGRSRTAHAGGHRDSPSGTDSQRARICACLAVIYFIRAQAYCCCWRSPCSTSTSQRD